MTRTLWTLVTLASHWRRNPVQIVALMVGLALATALWSGVQAINAEARASYAKATGLLGGPDVGLFRPTLGKSMTQEIFVDLRRAGYLVSPVIEGAIVVDGRRLRILGIEPVSLPPTAAPEGLEAAGEAGGLPAFLRPPWEALVGPETLARLAGNETLPPRRVDTSLPENLLVMDIGIAQQTLGMEGRISRLMMAADTALPAEVLERYRLTPLAVAERDVSAGLTDSFHLNLTAFGFLSFLVGLLIVRACVGLALEQRLATFRTLRACGVSARRLTVAVLIEVVLLSLLAGLAGLLLGYVIAAALLPDVAGSLRGLYGVSVSGTLRFAPEWVLSGMAMSMGGALLAAGSALWRVYNLPPLAAARPDAWRNAQEKQMRSSLIGAAVCAVVGALLYVSVDSLAAGFIIIGCMLLSAALALPALISTMLTVLSRATRSAMSEWMVADMRQQLPGLSLALVALLLALAANIGVGTMVGGFRETFLDWLDRRLAAEVYIRGADEAQARAIDDWAARQPEVRNVLPGRMIDTVLGGQPVELRSVVDAPTYREGWPLLAVAPDAWDVMFAGEGAMISEQLSYRLGLELGDTVDLRHGPLPILGIYADYGNPKGQVMLSLARLEQDFPEAGRMGTGIRLAPETVGPFLTRLSASFEVPPDNVIDQAALKTLSRQTFEKTFAVTAALNVLTLLVASVALFTALLTLFDRRVAQLAPVWALGIPRRRLALLELGKTVTMAALTAIVAVPVGLVLAWLLVAVVNVKAFGWRLPLIPYPEQWLTLGLLSIGVAAAAALLPCWRLSRVAPAQLLKVFANAR
ncbi:MAG: FtsX-like permease family protein [Pseudomonadota bacterium]